MPVMSAKNPYLLATPVVCIKCKRRTVKTRNANRICGRHPAGARQYGLALEAERKLRK